MRLLTGLLAVLVLAGAADAQERRIGAVPKEAAGRAGRGRWAVVIGVNEYASPQISPLRGAVADAKAIARVLVAHADFPESQVFTLTSDAEPKPTAENVLQKLADIREHAQPDDLILFFFAGHGVEMEGQRFLLTHDARMTSASALKLSSLWVAMLMQEIENLPVAHRIVMVDACRDDPVTRARRTVASETFATAFIFKPGPSRGVRATFLSCTTGQSAYEWSERGRGFFSYFIEKGLEGEAAQFGKVTLSSLDTYLNEMVPQAVREHQGKDQTPFVDRSGEALVLVTPERLATVTAAAAPTPVVLRRVYGVVKDSDGTPLAGAAVAVKAVASETSAVADEDGFFTFEIASEAVAQVTTRAEGFQSKTITSSPTDAGEKLKVFLTVAEPAESPGEELARAAYQALLVEDFDQAAATAREALAKDANSALALAVLANALAVEGVNRHLADGLDEAQKAYSRAYDAEPAMVALSLAHNARGLVAWGRGDTQEAQRQFEAALRVDPALGAASSNLGHLYLHYKKYKDAERVYRAAIKTSPESAVPYSGLAQVLIEQRRPKDAERAARDAISRYERRDPYLGLFYVNLAVALHQQGKPAEALEAVARAEELGVVENPAYAILKGNPSSRH